MGTKSAPAVAVAASAASIAALANMGAEDHRLALDSLVADDQQLDTAYETAKEKNARQRSALMALLGESPKAVAPKAKRKPKATSEVDGVKRKTTKDCISEFLKTVKTPQTAAQIHAGAKECGWVTKSADEAGELANIRQAIHSMIQAKDISVYENEEDARSSLYDLA